MTLPDPGIAALLVGVGVIAGFLNVVAGGGSLLTLPLLIFLGLPAATANGTNRIAIFCQNMAAITGFRRQGVFPARLALLCIPSALIGSYFGAQFAIGMSDETFRRLLAGIMLGVLILTLTDPFRALRGKELALTPARTGMIVFSFFGVGWYGGFVQAGVGFIIISALLVHGLDLVRINAIKVMVIFSFTLIALGVFMMHGEVDYALGFSLALGNTLGGWIATKVAVQKGHEWLQKIVSVTVFLFAIKLFFG